MRVVSIFILSLVLALMVGACATVPDDPTPGDSRLDDRVAPRVPTERAQPLADAERWHLWVAGPWAVDAVHDPWSPDARHAERWFFGPVVDLTAPPDGLMVLLSAGAVVSMNGSLGVETVQTAGLSHPRAISHDPGRVYIADADLGVLAFDRAELGLGALRASVAIDAHRLEATSVGLFAAVAADGGDAVVRLDADLSAHGRWSSSAWARIEDLAYGPDGVLYVVDGGSCVFLFDNPEQRQGEVEPMRSFCRPGRAYHGVLAVEDGDGYLAHDDGVDVFAELSTVEDHVSPRHVIERAGALWQPRHLAHGWAR